MNIVRKLSAALVCLIASGSAFADDIKITDAWAKAPAPGQKVVGVYFTVLSDRGVQLVKVSSTVAKSAELHESKQVNGMMQMRPVARMDVPPKHAITLAPNGAHVMLFDVTKKIAAGDRIPLTITFEDVNKKKTKVKVKALVKNE